MRLLLILLALFISISGFSYNNLKVVDPDTWWWQTPGTITEAEIAVRPVGAYIEYNLFLTMKAQEPENFSPQTQLEIVMDFELPYNSMITDSWLWIYGEPKQADIMDRWTATNIYEQIVNRRKDPSLLVKNGNNQYSINIYPMLPDESRKIKITYLAPANYNAGQFDVELPVNIFKLSTVPLGKVTAWIIPSQYYDIPITENENITFLLANHAEYGSCFKSEINGSDLDTHHLKLKKNQPGNINMSRYGNDTEGFYQLSFIPSDWIGQEEGFKKICFLVDFESNYYNESSNNILEKIKANIKNTINEKDLFNVIFSNLSLDQAFDNWMPATIANIDLAFNNAKITNYSNHTQLIAKGISFVNENEGSGKLVLISNYAEFKSHQTANEMIKDLNALNTEKIPINIIDYSNKNTQNYWVNNQRYIGNGYFFSNLARTNSGEYFQLIQKLSSNSFEQLFSQAFSDVAEEVISSIDIYTKCTNGFSYGRMNISPSLSNSFKVNKTVHQIGKYKGSMPSQVELSFEMNKQVWHALIDLNINNYISGDSLIQTIWQGIDIAQLEGQAQSNQVINEIVYQSIEHRILSTYTAFLCVEDSIDLSDFEDPGNEPGDEWLTNVDEVKSEYSIKTYPSPFTDVVHIELPSTKQLQTLKIYNMWGQCVKTVSINELEQLYTWDGTDDSGTPQKEGIYLVVATYGNKVMSTRVIKSR